MTYPDESVKIKRHHLDELRFYGFAGICVTRFQQLDDHLRDPFASLLTISDQEATIVFASIRTVKRRCEVIARLLEIRKPDFVDRWQSLTRRILQAESSRNSIAHGSPVFDGGGATVRIDEESDTIEVVERREPFFYLEKRGFTDWTTERLRAEAQQTESLLRDIYELSRDLGSI